VSQSKEWERITPESLRPAVEDIRKSFKTGAWKCRELTEALGFAALHPQEPMRTDFPAYQSQVPEYFKIIGPRAAEEFRRFVAMDTPPAFFRAYFDIFQSGVEGEIAKQFASLLQMGVANTGELSFGPVEWAQTHLRFLVRGISHISEQWIKVVCDSNARPKAGTTKEELDEMIHWRSWRAPNLIHMEPAGTTPFDPANAWSREDETRTDYLLKTRSARFLEFLDTFVENLAEEAHVRQTQSGKAASALPEKADTRYVSRAPKPISPVSGRNWIPSGPKSCRILVDFPPQFPPALIPRVVLVIDEAIKKFPTQVDTLKLCRQVLADIALHLSASVLPTELLSQAGDLIHYLLVANCDDSNRRFQLTQEMRRTEEWIRIAKMAAEGIEPKSASTTHTNTVYWEEIEITFLNEFSFQARRAGKLDEVRNYAVLGFEDGRTKKPTKAWEVLLDFAEGNGTIKQGGRTQVEFDKLRKRMQEIRNALKRHFCMTADPIEYVEDVGYQSRFKIKRGPSFHR
jgi:hypothetical protein